MLARGPVVPQTGCPPVSSATTWSIALSPWRWRSRHRRALGSSGLVTFALAFVVVSSLHQALLNCEHERCTANSSPTARLNELVGADSLSHGTGLSSTKLR